MSSFAGEQPDAIGWKNNHSFLIECKTSRADFIKDAEKHFRNFPEKGMGNFRLFLCEDGLINKDELPLGWGLLYVINGRVIQILGMHGNAGAMENGVFRFPANIRTERTLLLSALRREQKKKG